MKDDTPINVQMRAELAAGTQDWWKIIENDSESVYRLQFADWLREKNVNCPALIYALEWSANHGKYPEKGPDKGKRILWKWIYTSNIIKEEPHELTMFLFNCYRTTVSNYNHNNIRISFWWLAESLWFTHSYTSL